MNRSLHLIAVALMAFQIAPSAGAISVFVVKSGTTIPQPLSNARLELRGGAGGVLVTRTDVNGRYMFSSLAAGVYRLSITCDGFVRQEYPKRIEVGNGQLPTNVHFEMDLAPTAIGRVLDGYGQPMANVTIEALRRSYDVRGNPRFVRVASALTDDRGEYRIFWLDPGDYFFYATSTLSDDPNAPPLSTVSPTYFPGVSVPESAVSVRLDIGREAHVDFRLRAAALWSVRGQTMGATGRSVAASVTLVAPSEDPSFSRYTAQSLAAGPQPGEFLITDVPPGAYLLTARSGSGDDEVRIAQRINLAAVLQPPQPYSVALLLTPPFSIGGRLYAESRDPADLIRAKLALISTDPDLLSPKPALAQPNGQFTLKGVPLGDYVLEVSNLPYNVYLKAARFGNVDILDKPLTLGVKEVTTSLQVLLANDGGQLQVTAYKIDGEPHSEAKVVLVPDGRLREHRELYRVSTSDESGKAIFRGIPPGTYKLFAWDNPEPNAYLNPDYLRPYEALGVPIQIASGGNPAMSVQVISKD